MPHLSSSGRGKFFSVFQSLMEEGPRADDQCPRGAMRLGHAKIHVPVPAPPLTLDLGKAEPFRLSLVPEIRMDASGGFTCGEDYLLLDPQRYFEGIGGFVRVAQGDTLMLGSEDALQQGVFEYTHAVDARHLSLQLTPKGLVFQRESLTHPTLITPDGDPKLIDRQIAWRRAKLERLARLIEAPLEPMPRDAALGLLERVLEVLRDEPYRVRTRDGGPGGLLQIPAKPTPIIVGDLHAKIDNLLVILTQNGFLEALQDGSAVMIIIGDAVHPEDPGQEAEMETSMAMMDLILRLKLMFPSRVFYLRGNHDSFSEDISKGGVPQGLVWEKTLQDHRGARYRDAMQAFYDLLPYIALSPQFLTCHAGAPISKVSRDELIHVREHPRVEHQLTHGRLRQQNVPAGYRASDVKRLRKRLGLEPETPFIVGHTRLASEGCFWLNVGGIDHHHILCSASDERVGVITRVHRHMVPLSYPGEPLAPGFNALVRDGRPGAS
ncbi:metallophosphoesterase [Thiorhodococcus minor]|uniref:Metallophosphoesterase n=1 Tax=Thiorhodococcus minor TaxID=57489 RepID=A0A6M0K594_9GAMM|nr:metallophosphoesterase [Thiorhodococcus minor]NEV64093.1 metallophosphoesterase [Thiorhodococcus minor]